MNTDALTDSNNLGQFVSGKAAMTTDDGSWDVGQFTQQMGSNVGAMVPPFSTTPQHGVVYFPGDAISVMKESPNIPAAAEVPRLHGLARRRGPDRRGRADPRHQELSRQRTR